TPASRPAMASRKRRTLSGSRGFDVKSAQDRRGLATPLRQDSNEAARPNIEGNVNPGFHDEATTGERPIMRHLAIVAAQAGRDFQLDCFSGWTYEPPVGLGAAVQYAFMARQVLRNGGRATAFEIVWRGDDNAVVVSQLAHDEVGVPRDADPNNNVHSLVDQLHETIGQNELDRDLGIGPHEIAADRTDMGATQRMRGAHPQHALRFDAAMSQRRFGLVDFS